MAPRRLALFVALAALVGLPAVSPAAAAPKPKPNAGLHIVVDRVTAPIRYAAWPYPGDGPDVRFVTITGTLHGCAPGDLYLVGGDSTLGPALPNFALGQWDGVPCGPDGTVRISGSSWEDPEVGNLLRRGSKGVGSLFATPLPLCPEDPCNPGVTGSGKVRIPRR